jgi:hypothetical protein
VKKGVYVLAPYSAYVSGLSFAWARVIVGGPAAAYSHPIISFSSSTTTEINRYVPTQAKVKGDLLFSRHAT